MKHEEIRWNPGNKEWYCIKCGQTSDHIVRDDARRELERYECRFPIANPTALRHD